MRVAFFEPWFGGSHRAFLDAWCRHSAHAITVHGLPARHWKWRQEASAWELARRVSGEPPPDLIACSDFMDLPRLMGCLPPAWASVASLVYFHENQLTYRRAPEITGADTPLPEDFTHGFSNVLSAVRASAVVFNSDFHRADFQKAADELLRRLPRPNPRAALAESLEAAHVVAPLPELSSVPLGPGAPPTAPLRLVFPHRLEADKDPSTFLKAVLSASKEVELELVLVGGNLDQAAAPIREAAAAVGPLIVHGGYCEERAEYLRRIGEADVVVSTAQHEFFGLSFAEAMAAGCTPLAPNRLNYPTLVAGLPDPGRALFGPEEDLASRLVEFAQPARLAAIRSPELRGAIRTSVTGFGALEGSRALDAIVEATVSAM